MTLIADRMKALYLTDLAVSKELGIPLSTARNWRRGVRRPKLDKARALCKILQITVSDLRESIGGFHEETRTRTKTAAPGWITRRRMELGYTTEQLAKLVRLGLYFMKAIELKQRKLPISRVQDLADALEVSVADILANVETIADSDVKRRRTREELSAVHAEPPTVRTDANPVRQRKISANYYPNAVRAGTCIEGDHCPRFRCELCGTYFLLHVGHDCQTQNAEKPLTYR